MTRWLTRLGVLVADGVAELLGVLGSVATVVPSSPLHAARTGRPRPIVATPAKVRRWRWGWRSVMAEVVPSWEAVVAGRALSTVRGRSRRPHCPVVLGPDSQGTHSAGQADFLVAVRFVVVRLAAVFAVVLLGAAFLAGALAAAFLAGARLAGLGCSASRPSSNGLRNWPV